ncbi:MAG: SAM-dependent methyltransferase [Cyclobacteriaceae bacterium]|nr:SAM-dependent methyltransferase [Cyclobacteriaceae bacterium]
MKHSQKGKLYLIPTPLADNTLDKMVTMEMNEVIGKLDYFLVENLRTARRFVSSLKLGRVIEELRFEIVDKATKPQMVAALCAPLLRGKDIGLMSEAGCPGIADPGSLAVAFAHQHEVAVVPLVGPSAIFIALMASGFNGQAFAFHGYLPIEKPKRVQAIKALERESSSKKQTQIFMETPFRNEHLLLDILTNCQPQTLLCIARDINGESEMICTKSVKDWKTSIPKLHKIPTVFLIAT